MKQIIEKATAVIFVFVFSATCLLAQVPDSLIKGFKEGNAAVLSSYFNQDIELVVLSKDDVFSRAQAREIVADFFAGYKVKSFTVLHEGGKDDVSYAIGNLITDRGIFRVYFLVKKNDSGQAFIYQLRIEKQ